jgi:neutral amino acid transport system ATP-binding protein
MAGRLGLRAVANDLAGTLSGGQLKLLSVGMALLTRPDVLLLDEPTAGVNPVAIQTLIAMLTERRDAGLTTFVIEHNIAVVADLCATVYVLHAGRLLAKGTPDEVRRNALVVDAYLGKVVTSAG